jgi:hypothetical protein
MIESTDVHFDENLEIYYFCWKLDSDSFDIIDDV